MSKTTVWPVAFRARVVLIVGIAWWLAGSVCAQLAPVLAPFDAMNTLSGQSVSAGQVPAAPGGDPFAAQPGAAAPGAAPTGAFGAEGTAPAMPGVAGALGAFPGVLGAEGGAMAGAPAFNPFAAILEKKFKVIAGRRVYCKITGRMLDDAREMEVPESVANKNYYDDGTHGDEIPQDGIYSNIETVKDQYLSPEANDIRRRIESLIVHQEERDPMDFYLLSSVSLDSLSELSNEMKIEEERDKKVVGWATTFFETPSGSYRVTPSDIRSPFSPLYVPQPPPIPQGPIPPGFDPTVDPATATGSPASSGQPASEEGGYMENALGGPNNPSSAYFRTPPARDEERE